MSGQPNDALMAYRQAKRDAEKYFMHYLFADANDKLTDIDNYEKLVSALWAHFLDPKNKALLPAVMDDLKVFFHHEDDNHGQDCVKRTLALVGDASLIHIEGYDEYSAAGPKWPYYIKTVRTLFETFELHSHEKEKRVSRALPPSGNLKDDFVYYVRMAQMYKGDTAPGLRRHTVHRLMHMAKGAEVPYRSAHWGFLDARDWGRLEALANPEEFDLAAWEKHVADMQTLYEALPHPDKVIETQEEKTGIEKLRDERDIHGNPPELTSGYTPSQLDHLKKYYSE